MEFPNYEPTCESSFLFKTYRKKWWFFKRRECKKGLVINFLESKIKRKEKYELRKPNWLVVSNELKFLNSRF